MRWLSLVLCFALSVISSARAQELAPVAAPTADEDRTRSPGVVDLRVPRLVVDPYGYEIEKLYNDRPGLLFPIATIVAGALTVAVPASAMIGGWLFSGGDYLEDTSVGEFRGVIVAASVGVGVVGLGAGWLVHTIKRRTKHNRRINALREERRAYLSPGGIDQPTSILHW
jgi:hypothetical protein